MLKIFIAALFTFPIWADGISAPPPPACLSAPVTQGNVTLSCSLIDNTGSFGADPGLFSGGVQYVLQVRITSSDPAVVGMRLTVSSLADIGTPTAPSLITVTDSRSLSKTCSSQQPVAPGCDSGAYIYKYSLAPSSGSITSIQVQELKVSTTQTF